jgi:hypothetical protein
MTAVPPWLDLDRLEATVRAGDDHQWLTGALCVDEHSDLFFPEKNTVRAYRKAKAICRDCPSLYPCLAAHLHEQFGCFGETAPGERKAVRNTITARRQAAA